MHLYLGKKIWIAVCVCTGPTLFGFAGGWTAPLIPKLKDPDQTPLPDIITDVQASWVGSLVYIGLIFGPYITGPISNIVGRKPCLFIGGFLLALSYIILGASVNLPMLLIGRIITGLGSGILYVSNMVYVTEVASTNIRGTLVALTEVSSTVGTLSCYSISPYVPYACSSYLAAVIALIFSAAIFLVPETPVFYLMKGNEKKAKEVLKALGRSEDISDLCQVDVTSNKQDWIEIFSIKNNRKTFFITLTLVILQNCSGGWVLILFATSIFSLVESYIDCNISTIIIGAAMLMASSIATVVVDRCGRRKILLVSTAVDCLSMLLLGTYFYLSHIEHWMIPHLQWLPVLSVITFCFFFNIGFAIIPSTLMGEMYQSKVRGPGVTLTLTIGWTFGCIITTSFGYIITMYGSHVAFWVYAVACGVASVFTAVFVPETKGRTFAEIQCILSNK